MKSVGLSDCPQEKKLGWRKTTRFCLPQLGYFYEVDEMKLIFYEQANDNPFLWHSRGTVMKLTNQNLLFSGKAVRL
jgi:hypothetical protein